MRCQNNISLLLLFGCQYQVFSRSNTDLTSWYLLVCISNPTNHNLSKKLMSILTLKKKKLFLKPELGIHLMKRYQHHGNRFSDKSAFHSLGVCSHKVSGFDMFTESTVNGYLSSITLVQMRVFKGAVLRCTDIFMNN